MIDSLLRGKKADRVGVHDSPWHDTLRKWLGQGMPDDDGNPVDTVDHFGFDMAPAQRSNTGNTSPAPPSTSTS